MKDENFVDTKKSLKKRKHNNEDIFAVRVSNPKQFGPLLKKGAIKEGLTMGRYLEKVMMVDFQKKGLV